MLHDYLESLGFAMKPGNGDLYESEIGNVSVAKLTDGWMCLANPDTKAFEWVDLKAAGWRLDIASKAYTLAKGH